MKKLSFYILGLLAISAVSLQGLTSCSDKMDESNYYTFTSQMMSEYLKNNPEFSTFAEVVTRAGLMDQLSAYGKYTLFAPDNDAMNNYFAKYSIDLDQLSASECDTLARLHIVNGMYSVAEMPDSGTLGQNMLGRDVTTVHTQYNKHDVVKVNDIAMVDFDTEDDSVENGIVQPIDAVLETSNKMVFQLITDNKSLSLFSQALIATGLINKMSKTEDYDYYDNHKSLGEKYNAKYKTGSRGAEACEVPEHKRYGYTAFVVKDSVLKANYGIESLEGLWNLAYSIYGGSTSTYSSATLTDENDPLYKFMAYHVIDRNVHGYNLLTVKQDAGIDKDNVNPTEWYTTLLPYTMIKVEHLTAPAYLGKGTKNSYYINRRYDKNYQFEGTRVLPGVESGNVNNGPYGYYFYIDDILKFDSITRTVIDNTRIRMDFSTVFPEIQTNNLRMSGKKITASNSINDGAMNYYLPDGYLDNVTMSGTTRFIYWYPRSGYYSMNGDEFDAQGEFDISFPLPPVPSDGTYQIRLGFAPMNTTEDDAQFRGQAQVYVDGVVQGLPVDFSKTLNEVTGVTADYFNNSPDASSEKGKKYSVAIREGSKYGSKELQQADAKALKNSGYYRGPYSVFNSSDGTIGGKYNYFADMKNTARIVLCTLQLEAGKTHYLRLKNVSTVLPKQKEAMLDYLEIVPKGVYGAEGENAEDDM